MEGNNTKRLTYADIGYHEKPIKSLSRDELLEAFPELLQYHGLFQALKILDYKVQEI